MGDFTDLLQEAQKITVEIEGSKELPKVDRSIRQVLDASNDLYAKVAQSGAKDIQACVFIFKTTILAEMYVLGISY